MHSPVNADGTAGHFPRATLPVPSLLRLEACLHVGAPLPARRPCLGFLTMTGFPKIGRWQDGTLLEDSDPKPFRSAVARNGNLQ